MSVTSQKELLAASTPDPDTRTAVPKLDVERNELELVYRARGLDPEAAKEKAAAAGDGYAADDGHVGKTRVSAIVYPSSSAARSDNYRNNTLLKTFGSALKVREE